MRLRFRRAFLCAAYAAASLRCADHPPLVECRAGGDTFRSPVVETGRTRAYAITEARTGTKWGCANTARLYVARSGQPFQLVYTLMPINSSDTADSLLPIAWSHDGHWLAVEALFTTHLPTDAWAYGLLVYDARTGRTRELNTDFGPALSTIKHRDCDITLLSVDGFNHSGEIVLDLADTVDEEGLSRPCVGGHARWSLNPKTGRLR